MKEIFLVTRPKLQSDELVDLLKRQGSEVDVIIEPLCDVNFVKYCKKEIEDVKKDEIQAIFITSFNASESFLNFKFDKNVKIFAIGEKSVRKIRKNGYKNIFLPEKSNISELEKLFLQKNLRQTGKILSFCGNYVTKDLQLSLLEHKFAVKNILSYIVKYHDEFSERFLELAKSKKIDNFLCYSKNNAKCFAKLLRKYDLQNYFTDLDFIAISDEVAKEAENLGFLKVKTFNDYEFLTKY